MNHKIRYVLLILFLSFILILHAQASSNTDIDQPSQHISQSSLTSVSVNMLDEKTRSKHLLIGKVNISTLPTSLQSIENNAFEGTALESIIIPFNVTYIGNRAFADIPTLLTATFPDNTQFIANDAFNDSKQVLLQASINSYAQAWAKDNGLRFNFIVALNAMERTIQYSVQSNRAAYSEEKNNIEKTRKTDNNRERRTGRTVGELKASQYKGIAALYIQSRFFP